MKVSARELVTRLQVANKIVPVEATFWHYKGGDVRVTDLVINDKTKSVMVVYVSLHKEYLIKNVRPIEEWYEKCEQIIPADPWNGPGEAKVIVPRFRLSHQYKEICSRD